MRSVLLTVIVVLFVGPLHAAEETRLQSLQLADLGDVLPVAISADNQLLAVAFNNSDRNHVRLSGPIYAAEIAKDLEKYPRENGIGVWKITDGEFTHWLATEKTPSTIRFAPDGKRLIAIEEYGGMHVWDLKSREKLELEIAKDGDELRDVGGSFVFLANGERVAVKRTHGISIHSFPAGELLVECSGRFLTDVKHVAASADGKRVSANCRVWNTDTGELIAALDDPDSVRQTVFAPNGNSLVGLAFLQPRAVTLWDTTSNRLYKLFERGRKNGGEQWEVGCLALSPDARFVVTGGSDHKVCLWNTQTKALVAILEIRPRILRGSELGWGAQQIPKTVQFSPDGKLIVVSYIDTVECIDVAMLTPNPELREPFQLARFWVGNTLVHEEMTEPDPVPPTNQRVEAEATLRPGDIVLARRNRSEWMRARVVHVPDHEKVSVHFIGYSPQHQITERRSELQLP